MKLDRWWLATLALVVACGAQTATSGKEGPPPGGGGANSSGGSGGDKNVSQDEPNADEVPKRGEETASNQANPVTQAPACGTATPGWTYTIDSAPVSTTGMASATRVRELLGSGFAPPQGMLRAEDVFHYYHSNLPDFGTLAPGALEVNMAMAPRKIAGQVVPNQADLFVGIQAGPTLNRPHVVLTLLVDTSLSMQGEGLARARAAVSALGNGLKPGDRVTLMTSDQTQGEQTKDLTDPPADMTSLADLLSMGADVSIIPQISAALARAKEKDLPDSWNRLLLIGDGEGDANGRPQTELVNSATATHPILTGSVGVGPANHYHDRLMFLTARDGHGPYVYIDSEIEAEAVLGARFDEVVGISHGAVGVHLDLPWFMHSLDPQVTLGTADTQAGHDLSPGGLATFLFRVAVCDLTMLEQQQLAGTIDVTVSYLQPGVPDAQPVSLSIEPSTILTSSSPEIDQWLATQAYYDAISGGTADRLKEALDLLTPLAAAAPNGAFDEMHKLVVARQSLGTP